MPLADIVLIGAILSAGIALWRWKRNKGNQMSSKKTRLNVSLEPAEYALIQDWAARNELTLSDYVRKTLVESVPRAERDKTAAAEINDDLISRVFDALDENEGEVGVPGILGLPPARKQPKGVLTEAERTDPRQRVIRTSKMTLPTVPPGPHPCVYLSLAVPNHMRGQCQGQCEHPEQSGRFCHWAPTSAHGCPLFVSRAVVGARTTART